MDGIEVLLADQDGIIARRQAFDGGMSRAEIAGRLKRREWVTVYPGVYAAQTGRLSWQQRAWAAVLALWPAALSHESSLRAFEGPGRRTRDTARIHVAVARGRNLVAPEGVRLHRVSRLDARVQWNLSPPRIRYNDSVLEHAYLVRVERPHGLPRGNRQADAKYDGRPMLRDVEYDELVVELDGRLFHDDAAARDRDLERDLDTAIVGKDTIRLGYGQVLERSCATAAKVGAVLQARGWPGRATDCTKCQSLAKCG